MIASLRGTVQSVSGTMLILEVGGIGYAVLVTPRHARSLRDGSDAFIHTALIVRDDELSLCGFESREDLEAFDLLRSVSGVGPKSALGVLAELSASEVADAVAREDHAAFRRVSGIGPKTAKLITISLQGKLDHLAAPASSAAATGGMRGGPIAETVAALVGLGFQERRAVTAVEALVAESPDADSAMLLRSALRALGSAPPAGSTGS